MYTEMQMAYLRAYVKFLASLAFWQNLLGDSSGAEIKPMQLPRGERGLLKYIVVRSSSFQPGPERGATLQ